MCRELDPRADSGQPTVYQIRITGQLGSRWADWFEGLTITLDGGDTLMTGPVVDQATLHGLLKRVRDLGMPLVSVSPVESGPPTTRRIGQAGMSEVRLEERPGPFVATGVARGRPRDRPTGRARDGATHRSHRDRADPSGRATRGTSVSWTASSARSRSRSMSWAMLNSRPIDPGDQGRERVTIAPSRLLDQLSPQGPVPRSGRMRRFRTIGREGMSIVPSVVGQTCGASSAPGALETPARPEGCRDADGRLGRRRCRAPHPLPPRLAPSRPSSANSGSTMRRRPRSSMPLPGRIRRSWRSTAVVSSDGAETSRSTWRRARCRSGSGRLPQPARPGAAHTETEGRSIVP